MAAWAMALGVTLASGSSGANGRFPAANYFVVGPGADARLMVLRTTFGLVVSEDYGRTWSWTCEDGYGAMGMYDPSLALGGDGTIIAGLTTGISVSASHCAYTRPTGDPRVQIVDLASDATGHTVAAALGPFTSDNGISVSNDDGHTWRPGAHRPAFFVETVEVAPSDPMRMYLTGYLTGAVVILLRSDDGGMTMREVTRDVGGGNDAFVAGVDPTNPDVLYVRSNFELGTYLLRSDDGGAHLRRVATTRARMLGFAVSDDGQTVWIGSTDPTEGLQRSVRGGAFERVGGRVSVSCLRYHAGVLFVCASEELDGYSLGYSVDRGERIMPVMSARDVTAPRCARGTPVGDVCGPLWPAQDMIIRSLEAGVASMRGIDAEVFARPDAPGDIATDLAMDANVDAPSDIAMDAGDATGPDALDAASEAMADAGPADLAVGADVREDRPDVADVSVARDAARDAALDAPIARTQPGSCDCEVGVPAARASGWRMFVLAMLGGSGRRLRRRARRRAAEQRASGDLWRP